MTELSSYVRFLHVRQVVSVLEKENEFKKHESETKPEILQLSFNFHFFQLSRFQMSLESRIDQETIIDDDQIVGKDQRNFVNIKKNFECV